MYVIQGVNQKLGQSRGMGVAHMARLCIIIARMNTYIVGR